MKKKRRGEGRGEDKKFKKKEEEKRKRKKRRIAKTEMAEESLRNFHVARMLLTRAINL